MTHCLNSSLELTVSSIKFG